jgi:hypothetical protein
VSSQRPHVRNEQVIDAEFEALEGVWTGVERGRDGSRDYDASGRLVFQTVFDGRFLLCDYMQTAPERPTMFAHGVFRRDGRANAIAVTWFRSPGASPNQDAVAEDGGLTFLEKIDGRTTRTSYRVVMDRLSVQTDRAIGDDKWERVFEGSYRRR